MKTAENDNNNNNSNNNKNKTRPPDALASRAPSVPFSDGQPSRGGSSVR